MATSRRRHRQSRFATAAKRHAFRYAYTGHDYNASSCNRARGTSCSVCVCPRWAQHRSIRSPVLPCSCLIARFTPPNWSQTTQTLPQTTTVVLSFAPPFTNVMRPLTLLSSSTQCRPQLLQDGHHSKARQGPQARLHKLRSTVRTPVLGPHPHFHSPHNLHHLASMKAFFIRRALPSRFVSGCCILLLSFSNGGPVAHVKLPSSFTADSTSIIRTHARACNGSPGKEEPFPTRHAGLRQPSSRWCHPWSLSPSAVLKAI